MQLQRLMAFCWSWMKSRMNDRQGLWWPVFRLPLSNIISYQLHSPAYSLVMFYFFLKAFCVWAFAHATPSAWNVLPFLLLPHSSWSSGSTEASLPSRSQPRLLSLGFVFPQHLHLLITVLTIMSPNCLFTCPHKSSSSLKASPWVTPLYNPRIHPYDDLRLGPQQIFDNWVANGCRRKK